MTYSSTLHGDPRRNLQATEGTGNSGSTSPPFPDGYWVLVRNSGDRYSNHRINVGGPTFSVGFFVEFNGGVLN